MRPADGQRRFRRRGGAKKKKNNKPISEPAQPASTLDADLTSYLSHLQTTLQTLDPDGTLARTHQHIPSDEPPSSVLLARNALRELSPRVHELARDASASRLLEALLHACADPGAVAEPLAAALAAGPNRFSAFAAHHAASHVLDAMLRALEAFHGHDETKQVLGLLADTVAKWTPADVVEVITSASGSHSFRGIVATLAGLPAEEPREAKLDDSQRGRIRSYVETMAVDVPGEWRQAVCGIAEGLLQSEALKLKDMLWTPAPCAALQALLAGVSVGDKALAKRLAERCMDEEEERLMRHACGSRFVERAVLCLGAGVVEGAYKGRLDELARDAKANFVVQRILLGLRGRGEVMSAWDELEEAVPGMLGLGKAREGVVLSLLRATEAEGDENCLRRASRCVARACGAVGEKAKGLAGVVMLGSEEMWERWRKDVKEMGRAGMGVRGEAGDVLRVPKRVGSASLLGGLIARCVMRFPGGAGQGMRDSMGALSGEEMLALAGDAVGSRVVEQWVEGERGVGSRKNAGKVMKAVCREEEKESILAVVRNPYGARVVIKCAGVVAGPVRRRIMEALASDFKGLKTHDCGEMVVRKCRVEQYMRRGEEWEREETARETRERMFKEILQDDGEGDGGVVGKKRKRKRTEKGGESEDTPSRKNVAETDAVAKGDDGENEDGDNEAGLENVLGAIRETAAVSKRKKKKKKQKHSE